MDVLYMNHDEMQLLFFTSSTSYTIQHYFFGYAYCGREELDVFLKRSNSSGEFWGGLFWWGGRIGRERLDADQIIVASLLSIPSDIGVALTLGAPGAESFPPF